MKEGRERGREQVDKSESECNQDEWKFVNRKLRLKYFKRHRLTDFSLTLMKSFQDWNHQGSLFDFYNSSFILILFHVNQFWRLTSALSLTPRNPSILSPNKSFIQKSCLCLSMNDTRKMQEGWTVLLLQKLPHLDFNFLLPLVKERRAMVYKLFFFTLYQHHD